MYTYTLWIPVAESSDIVCLGSLTMLGITEIMGKTTKEKASDCHTTNPRRKIIFPGQWYTYAVTAVKL